MQNPGWRAQRHRRGRRPEGRNCPRPKLDLMPSPSHSRLATLERPPLASAFSLFATNRDRRSRESPPPPAEGRCRSAPKPGSLYPKPRTATRRVATCSAQSSAPFAKLVLGRAHRRAMRASRPAQPRSTHCRLAEAGGPSPPPATGPQNSLRSFAPAQATDRKTAPPTVSVRAPWEILPFQLIVETVYFPLKAWRAGAARHANRTCRAQFAWTARLGDSFYFARCEIVESLLRRGARGELSR